MAISLPIVSKFDDKGISDAQLSISGFQGIALGVFTKIGAAAVTAFADAAGAAVDFGKQSILAAVEAQAVTRQLENAAKNSGAFGNTAASIKEATNALDKHSTALAELSGIDDETINKIKSRWMTVPSIVALGTKGINNLAEVSANVAAATGKDIESIGLMFTKVAGDNETALSKLTRAGVVLSDEQKNVYNNLLASNKEAEAQAYLIEQLGIKYAGSAEAMSSPLDRIKVSWENLKETIGMAFMPAIEAAVPKIQKFINLLMADPKFTQFLADIGSKFEVMLPKVGAVLEKLGDLLLNILPGLNPLLDIMGGLLDTISIGLKNVSTDSKTLWKDFENLAYIIANINSGLSDWNKFLADTKVNLDGFGPFVEGIFNAISRSLNPVSAGLEAIANLIRWINGNPVQTSGITLNYDGSPNRDGDPATPFALGGIVTGPTHALIGEAGPEAVIPLDKFDQVVGGRGGINIVVNAGMGTDGAALGEQIVNAVRRYERSSGAVWARA